MPPLTTAPRRRRLFSLDNPSIGRLPTKKKQPAAEPVQPEANCCDAPRIEEEDGHKICKNCFTQIAENDIVNDVTFEEDARGAHTVQGGFISDSARHARTLGAGIRRLGGDQRNSMQEVEANGRRAFNSMCPRLGIPEVVSNQAAQLFIIASKNRFSSGRKTEEVAAACLYAAARRQKENTLMLMDLAEILEVNVFRLGEVYKDMCRDLYLEDETNNGPVVGTQFLVEVENLVMKYCRQLEFGDATKQVAEDAVKILKRMKRDWMVTGRHPAGLCGACIILAARMNNFRRSTREVVFVAKIADVTIAKRIEEFRRTKAAALTVEQFRKFGTRLKHQHDPPILYENELRKMKFEDKKRKRQAQNKARTQEIIEIPDDGSSDTSSRAPSVDESTPEPGAGDENEARRKRLRMASGLPTPMASQSTVAPTQTQQTRTSAESTPQAGTDGSAADNLPADSTAGNGEQRPLKRPDDPSEQNEDEESRKRLKNASGLPIPIEAPHAGVTNQTPQTTTSSGTTPQPEVGGSAAPLLPGDNTNENQRPQTRSAGSDGPSQNEGNRKKQKPMSGLPTPATNQTTPASSQTPRTTTSTDPAPRYDADGFAIPALPANDTNETPQPAKRGRKKKQPPEPIVITNEELATEEELERDIDQTLAEDEIIESRDEIQQAKDRELAKKTADEQKEIAAANNKKRREAEGVNWWDENNAPTGDVVTDEDLMKEFENDPEVMYCELDPEEQKVKEQIWVTHNEDWLRQQYEKELIAGMAEENPPVAPKRGGKGRRKRSQLGDGSTLAEATTPIETPADATKLMLAKQATPAFSTNLDYALLQKIYGKKFPRSSRDNSQTASGNATSQESSSEEQTPGGTRGQTPDVAERDPADNGEGENRGDSQSPEQDRSESEDHDDVRSQNSGESDGDQSVSASEADDSRPIPKALRSAPKESRPAPRKSRSAPKKGATSRRASPLRPTESSSHTQTARATEVVQEAGRDNEDGQTRSQGANYDNDDDEEDDNASDDGEQGGWFSTGGGYGSDGGYDDDDEDYSRGLNYAANLTDDFDNFDY